MWLFVLLMLAQILPGIGWAVRNIGHLAMFEETSLLLKSAENLVIDEYMGILYPVLIALAKGVTKVLPVPYYSLLYIVQLGMALFASVYMLKFTGWIKGKARSRKLMTALAAGYFLTFPLLLQLHMAVLPYSLAMSIAVILICDGFYYLRNTDGFSGRALIRLCGLWLLDVLLVPDYSWLLGIFTGGVLLRVLLKNKIWRMRILTALLSTVLCFGVISTTTQTPGSMGRIQKSLGASMVSRFVWPYFGWNSFFWDEKITDLLDDKELTFISKYPEEVIYNFGPVLEEKYGREAADDIYWDMAAVSFNLGTKQALIDLGRDFAAYLCPPAALQNQMESNTSSLLAWNYGRMQEEAPVLTKYYVRVSAIGWNVMCLFGGLLILQLVLSEKRKIKPGYSQVLLSVSVLFMALWYTMSGAGVQDYKNVMLISFLWLLPVVRGFLCMRSNTEVLGQQRANGCSCPGTPVFHKGRNDTADIADSFRHPNC